jgi:transcriptional regulator with XRE-family HTH domain
LRELGEYLKQMRKAQNLTLSEVADRIKVNIRYLEALEESNLEVLPPEVYVRGFIKAYGELLGADMDELYSRYDSGKPKKSSFSLFHRSSPTKEKPAFVKNTKKTPSTQENKGKPAKSQEEPAQTPTRLKGSSLTEGGLKPRHLIIGISIVAVLLVILAVSKNIGKKPPASKKAMPVLVVNTDSIESSTPIEKPISAEDLLQEVILPMGEINPSSAISRAESLVLSIRVRKDVDLYLESDYKREFKSTIRASEEKTFRAKNSFYLETSKPELMAIKVNGFDLVPGDRLYEVTNTPPQAVKLVMDINRANIMRFLDGYREVVLPTLSGHAVTDSAARGDSTRRTITVPPRRPAQTGTQTPKPAADKPANGRKSDADEPPPFRPRSIKTD